MQYEIYEQITRAASASSQFVNSLHWLSVNRVGVDCSYFLDGISLWLIFLLMSSSRLAARMEPPFGQPKNSYSRGLPSRRWLSDGHQDCAFLLKLQTIGAVVQCQLLVLLKI
jgi:hypothetical protein